jgi:ubiquinone/menaquinone biosynthesis C-methylase UbiE
MTETTTTSATYDRIAPNYAAQWSDKVAILARQRAQFMALLPPHARVLDVGCGPGHDAAQFRSHGLRACGLDRSRGMLREAQARAALPLLLGDMRCLPFADGTFDGLWVSASFLHIPKRDNLAVLCEMRRVLRPDGVLYIGVKQGHGERYVSDKEGQQRFFVFYQDDELDALLEHAGFVVRVRRRDDDTLGREPWLNRFVEKSNTQQTSMSFRAGEPQS